MIISDGLLRISLHGRPSVQRPARTYLQQPRGDTGCSLEDLPGAMDDIDGWREKVREICACRMTWWWWWYHHHQVELIVWRLLTLSLSFSLALSIVLSLSLSLPLPHSILTVHHFWRVIWTASGVRTELMCVVFRSLASTSVSMRQSPQQKSLLGVSLCL